MYEWSNNNYENFYLFFGYYANICFVVPKIVNDIIFVTYIEEIIFFYFVKQMLVFL